MKRTSRSRPRFLALVAVVGAVSLAAAGTGAAEDGNIANGSVGTVQVGDTGVEVGGAVAGPTDGADASARTALASGGNEASNAIGTVQAGGANSASGSLGTAQVGSGGASSGAGASVAGNQAQASVPATLTEGDNQASGSVATAQIGGGNSASDSIGSAHVSADGAADATATSGDTTVNAGRPVDVTVDNDGVANDSLSLRSDGLFEPFQAETIVPVVQAAIEAALAVADPVVDALEPAVEVVDPAIDAGFTLERDIVIDLARASIEVRSLNAEPDVAVAGAPVGQAAVAAPIGVAPNGGNSSTDSFGTVQLGATSAAPSLTLGLDPVDSSVALGGGTTVGGDGANSSTGSIGTAQVGGGNSASDSIGTVQAGSVATGPTLSASTPLAAGGAGAPLEIGGGGGNSAGDSIGTGQIGGGTAEGSTGTLQAGAVGVSPSVGAEDSVTGESLSFAGGTAIGGSGEPNFAGDSIGSVQIGAGNSATGSIGTFQIGAGGGPGSTESGSESIGALSLPGPSGASSATDAEALILARAGRPSDRPVRQQAMPGQRPKPGILRTIANSFPSIRGTLPFTGFGGVALLFGLGLALFATGFGLRRALTIAR